MTLKQFQQMLLCELKRSWQKSAVLAVLLVVGCVFWLPPLLRMVQGSSTAAPSPVAKPVNSEDIRPDDAPQKLKSKFDWKETDKVLASDLLLQPFDRFGDISDPFEVDYDQFSPPILFTDDTNASEPIAAVESKPVAPLAVVAPPLGLLLKGTFLGSQRKAAYINRRLYYEGMQIRHGSTSWLITSIQPRRVILSHGGQNYELKILSPTQLGNQHSAVDPSQPNSER